MVVGGGVLVGTRVLIGGRVAFSVGGAVRGGAVGVVGAAVVGPVAGGAGSVQAAAVRSRNASGVGFGGSVVLAGAAVATAGGVGDFGAPFSRPVRLESWAVPEISAPLPLSSAWSAASDSGHSEHP
jgi:hypothetical protein